MDRSQRFQQLPPQQQLDRTLQLAQRLDWPSQGRRPGIFEESLGQKVNGRVALTFWGTLTGTVKGLVGGSQNQPQCPPKLNEENKWTFMGPTLYRSAPFISIDNSRRSIFGSVGDSFTSITSNAPSSSSSSNSKDKDKMSGGAALMFGLMGLGALIGSIVLFFPASAQLLRDRSLLRQVRQGKDDLVTEERNVSGPVERELHQSTLRSYEDMEKALAVRVKQEMWLVATDALLAITGVLGLTAAFSESWRWGKAALAAGCGTTILFTVTVMVGSSQEDRDEFFGNQNHEHQYRNGALYTNGREWISRFGHTAAVAQQMSTPIPSAPPMDPYQHVPHYHPNLNSDELSGFQASGLPQNETPYFEDPKAKKGGRF